MAVIVTDASTIIKWFIPEEHHQEARALRDDYLDGEHKLIAPALLPFEVINGLRYATDFDTGELEDASQAITDYGIEFVSFPMCGSVATVAEDIDNTVYDAAYVALADARNATMYTADKALHDLDDSQYSNRIHDIADYE